jgi:hypothetical protein
VRSSHRWWVAAVVAVATGAMPAVAHAEASAGATRIKVFATHTAGGTVFFPSRVRVTPSLLRPSCDEHSYIASFVGVELTRPGTTFTYVGLLWCDGSAFSGELTANEWSAQETGYASTSGGLPRRVETSPVWLSAGRYQLVVLSRGPTAVELAVKGEPPTIRAMTASKQIDVGENWAVYDGAAASSSAARRLAVNVPVGSHAALLMDEQKWQGVGDTSYAYTACLGTTQLPCVAVPIPGVNPDLRVGDGAAEGAVVVVKPPSGSRVANFYSSQSGLTTYQELLALALP